MIGRRKKWSSYFLPTGRIEVNEAVRGTEGSYSRLVRLLMKFGTLGPGIKWL